MDDSNFIESISELCQEWNETETWVKQGENTSRAAVAPAINELRYAGRRLVDAFAAHKQGDSNKAKSHIEATKDNLNKAKHDVLDALVFFYGDAAGILREQIGKGEAMTRFPKYGELFSLIKQMEEGIQLSRKNRDDRNSIYNELFQKLPELKSLHDEFMVCHTAITDQIEKDRIEIASNRHYRNIAIIVGIIGLVIGIFGLIN